MGLEVHDLTALHQEALYCKLYGSSNVNERLSEGYGT